MNGKDHVLIDNFSQFYLRPIYLFKNSNHIFDNETTISEITSKYRIIDKQQEIKNHSFIDSKSDFFIQASDIFVGLMGKLFSYTNTSTTEKIISDFESLSEIQIKNIDCLISLIKKSNNKNVAFMHSIVSYEELAKMSLISEIRSINHA